MPNESLFDISGLLDSITGVFDDDFIAKVQDMSTKCINACIFCKADVAHKELEWGAP